MTDSLILGIDAAWTAKNPSGVALVQGQGKKWKLIAACSSYQSFLDLKVGQLVIDDQGGEANPKALLEKCKELSGGLSVKVVAVDMPLGRELIKGRRAADNQVSQQYGARGCAVHSPSAARPGKISVDLTNGFEAQSFPLVVSETALPSTPALLEVYPHVALVELMGLEKRLPYKVSKSTRYWPTKGKEGRFDLIAENIQLAWKALGNDIELPPLPIPPMLRVLSQLKAYEDLLDGVVCAWMGMKYLAGEAKPLGDGEGAIWVPK
jgi:predicted RNase H-like nuclease